MTAASAVDDWEKYNAYKQRRADRRAYALAARRAYNAGKVHVYRTAVAVQVNPVGIPAIQQGWIYQPPIPRPSILDWWPGDIPLPITDPCIRVYTVDEGY